MRRLLISCLLALGTCALSSWGRAADLPLLRGPETFVPGFAECCSKFAGVYVGGQVGASASSVDFSLATQSVIAQMLQQTALENEAAVSTWQVLNHTDTRGRTYGGFIGYNMGWESVVLGFEINYSRIDSNSTALGTPLSRIVSTSSFNYDVTLNGGAGINVKDIATFAGARAGRWEISCLMRCSGWLPRVPTCSAAAAHSGRKARSTFHPSSLRSRSPRRRRRITPSCSDGPSGAVLTSWC